MEEKYVPNWLTANGQVDELTFVREFLKNYRKMIYVDGAFFTTNGRISDENLLRKEIYIFLSRSIKFGLSRKVERILDVMRIECFQQELPHQEDRIHLANGTFYLEPEGFAREMEFCRYRLPVRYDPEAPRPERWLQFLSQLLEPEDILTLQEYMGYCLIPTTRGQKMLIITGQGGEGKSRIGVVMKSIFGCNMNVGSIAKLETSPFARADLQHLLVHVDDDLKMEALTQTNNIKAIVTAELPMDLERKGIQSYQGILHARLMAFGNGSLQALYDRSYGFFRRQIILSTKARDPERVDDPFLADKLLQEKEGIFLWCLEGLQRLRSNKFHFTISRQALDNLEESVTDGNNVLAFLRSEGYFRLEPDGLSTSRALYNVYRDWCMDNSFHPLNARSFLISLKENGGSFHINPTNHIPIGNGKEARGFKGIKLLSRF